MPSSQTHPAARAGDRAEGARVVLRADEDPLVEFVDRLPPVDEAEADARRVMGDQHANSVAPVADRGPRQDGVGKRDRRLDQRRARVRTLGGDAVDLEPPVTQLPPGR